MKKNTVLLEKLPEERIEKSKIVALMNNKGGVGKTTTSVAFGMHMARMGKNVLFWDNDPQSNLSQRLGLSDDQFKEKRLNTLFRISDMEGMEEKQKKLSLIIEYPYLYRIKGTVVKPGKVGLMAGSHDSETEANSAHERLMRSGFDVEHRDIFKFFHESVSYYKNYYDLIVIDTAPALEGNILNRLAVRTADDVISPVDGLEAAFGVKQLLSWINGETRRDNSGLDRQPNVLFAMVKYQMDTKNIGTDASDLRLRNLVYRAMQDSFGDFVCNNGVRESRKLRSLVSGFRKTDYTELCKEIINKISQPRENIFNYVTPEIFKNFSTRLGKIELKNLEKKPTFMTPQYQNGAK